MNRKIFSLLSLVLTLAIAPVASAMQPFNAQYSVNYKGISAVAVARIAPVRSGTWVYTMSIDHMLASMGQATVFQDRAGQYRPLGGSDHSSYASIKRKNTTHYDWAKGTVRWTGDVKPGRAGPLRLQPGDMDALLVNLAVVRDVTAGRAMHYRMIENGRARNSDFRVLGKEVVTVAGRRYWAMKVGSARGNKQTLAWVVRGIPVPVRILQRENGSDTLSLTMSKWSY